MTINQFRKSSKKSGFGPDGVFVHIVAARGDNSRNGAGIPQIAVKAPRPLAGDPKRWLSAKN
jgi:hypothetical protein